MLQSGAFDYYERFATDIGIFFINKKNDQNAFKWFKRAFEMNISEATVNNLGIMYMNGIGVEKDFGKAEELFTIGIEKGFSSSYYHLAFIFLEKKQNKMALKYFKNAADKGNNHARNSYFYLLNKENNCFDAENKEFELSNPAIFIHDK